MDPITIGLGTKVMEVLIPYVKKGAEQFAKDVGVATCEKVEGLAKTLKAKLSGDKKATDIIGYFEEDPESFRPALEKIIQKKVEQDKELAAELDQRLKNIGPDLKIIQKMKEAEEVTGLKAEEMTEGTAEVVQDIEKGKKITGMEISRIGK